MYNIFLRLSAVCSGDNLRHPLAWRVAVSALYSYEYRTGTKYWSSWTYLLGAGGAFVGYLDTVAIVTARVSVDALRVLLDCALGFFPLYQCNRVLLLQLFNI